MNASRRLPISVLIPTHAKPEALRRCLRSICRQSLPRQRYEVVVISNVADVETARVIQEECGKLNVEYRVVGQVGVNFARNLGLSLCRGDLIQFLDDDCELAHERHLETVLEAHALHSEVAAIGGGYQTAAGDPGRCRVYNNIINGWLCSQSPSNEGGIVLLGGNMSLKRALLPCGARFDETIAFGGSEVSFQQELFATGLRSRIERGLDVLHRFHGPVGDLPKKAWLQGRGKRGRTELRRRGRLRRWASYLAREPMSLQERAEILAVAPIYLGVAQLGWLLAEAEHRFGISYRREALNFNA